MIFIYIVQVSDVMSMPKLVCIAPVNTHLFT